MRTLILTAALTLSLAVPIQAAPKVEDKPPEKPAEPMKTSEQIKRESVEGAVTSPLRDLNVVKAKIPDVLLKAMEDPYARPPRGAKCSVIARLVKPLDAALGPDADQLPLDGGDLMDRGRATALGVAGDLASDFIPFRGWVRKLSGAERHDKLVQSAILAGAMRRAYLKGLGETKGCPPPASPTHERSKVADKAKPKE